MEEDKISNRWNVGKCTFLKADSYKHKSRSFALQSEIPWYEWPAPPNLTRKPSEEIIFNNLRAVWQWPCTFWTFLAVEYLRVGWVDGNELSGSRLKSGLCCLVWRRWQECALRSQGLCLPILLRLGNLVVRFGQGVGMKVWTYNSNE